MKVLVLNGSPRGKKSSTLQLTNAFVEGLSQDAANEVESIDLSKKDINHCLGCYTCWTKTPGKCVFQDDMADLLDKYLAADLIIWSFPLYYFGMPSKIKAFMDRLLPSVLPFMSATPGEQGHPPRYDLSHQKYVVISTCGFYHTENNYDGVVRQFDIMYKNDYTKILCTEGHLFKMPQLRGRIEEYLEHVKQAGVQFAGSNEISQETTAMLASKLYPVEAFIEMANAEWDINDSLQGESKPKERSYRFMRQMAATYNPSAGDGKDMIVEMHFTDLNKTYQLIITDGKCVASENTDAKYTVRIETPYDVWMDVSEGRISGSQAMFEQKYKVLGDFDTMLQVDKFFGSAKPPTASPKPKSKPKKTNMLFLLLPWLILWILVPINPIIAGSVAIGFAALTPLIGFKIKLTAYDKISLTMVALLGLWAMLDTQIVLLACATYLAFGLLWLISGFSKFPLTAMYSSKNYDGEEAFDNPLFMKTNKILTITWGVLYLVGALAAYFLISSALALYTGAFLAAIPALMGGFTAWFSKWYPAKVARG